MTEWLDIVDQHDEVVGRASRRAVHAEGHLHRSSHTVLFNSSGQVMVQLRSLSKDTNPGLWDTSAAGHVDSGETYLQCAVRELQEELGIILSGNDFSRIGKLQPEARNGFEFTEVFTAYSDQQLILEASEVIDALWKMPQELDSWIASRPEEFTDVFRVIWQMVIEHQRSSESSGQANAMGPLDHS